MALEILFDNADWYPQPQTRPSPWLTAAEAARYLKVKSRTLLLWVRQGKIKAHALSGTKRHVWRFKKADLDATMDVPSVALANGRIQ
jgi:excisionase family DNA binding protein